jgi:nitrite reductase/ring-hydroxylating ferredoxin subunit/uncharacterized membrane protein
MDPSFRTDTRFLPSAVPIMRSATKAVQPAAIQVFWRVQTIQPTAKERPVPPMCGTPAPQTSRSEAARPISAWTEPVIQSLEASEPLNALGKWLSNAFHRVVRSGGVKDALAGTWMAHPMHPMLTDVTIGVWTSAAILDVFGGERARPAADMLVGVGVLSAAPTVISGLSDLTDIVDPEQRSLGTAHALANVGAVTLWALSYLTRKGGSRSAGIALSMLANGTMAIGGFLGGHLSYRKGVGVDQTTFRHRFEEWTAVMDKGDLKEDLPRRVMVSGTNVFLLRRGETIHALANRCTHRGGPLHKGRVDEASVTCPWHLSSFRLQDGSVIRGPATAPQPAYQVRVREGKIEIRERARWSGGS